MPDEGVWPFSSGLCQKEGDPIGSEIGLWELMEDEGEWGGGDQELEDWQLLRMSNWAHEPAAPIQPLLPYSLQSLELWLPPPAPGSAVPLWNLRFLPSKLFAFTWFWKEWEALLEAVVWGRPRNLQGTSPVPWALGPLLRGNPIPEPCRAMNLNPSLWSQRKLGSPRSLLRSPGQHRGQSPYGSGHSGCLNLGLPLALGPIISGGCSRQAEAGPGFRVSPGSAELTSDQSPDMPEHQWTASMSNSQPTGCMP